MIGSVRSLVSYLLSLILALLVALIIWSIAIQESDPLQKELYRIPVQVIGLAADSQISNAPTVVEIRAEAPSSVLGALTPEEFTAEIEVTDLPVGEHAVDVLVRHDVPNLVIDYQSPEQVVVGIERIITKEIPVVVDVRGDVARGYQQGEPFVDPDVIMVTGISSRVEPLAEAQIDIFLDSPREDVVLARTPVFYNRQGEIASVSGLNPSTREVQVTIPVDQLAGFGVKPIIVDWTGEPATGYRVLSVSAQPDSALVTGRPAQVEQVNFVRTETIDITGLRESITVPTALNLPNGLTLEDFQSVVVSIEIEPIITTDVVRQVPEIRNLGEGLTATLDAEEVVVFLAGPYDRLESLTENDIVVTVDLFGLITGTYRLAPEATILVGDIEVRSIQPPEITVEISATITVTEQLTETLPFPNLLVQDVGIDAHPTSSQGSPALFTAGWVSPWQPRRIRSS